MKRIIRIDENRTRQIRLANTFHCIRIIRVGNDRIDIVSIEPHTNNMALTAENAENKNVNREV